MTVFKRSIWYSVAALQFLIMSCNGQVKQRASIDPKMMDTVNVENYGIPKVIAASDTSPAWETRGQKLLLTGTVYQPDGKTPAENVTLYYYQTNVNGVYEFDESKPTNLPRNSLGQTHGYIRGWVKTGKDGKYAIYTIRPGMYPTRDEPSHIHITVLEPGKKSYYIDDFVFDDERILTSARRDKMENRGSSGVLRLVKKKDLQVGERNIYLGLNVPGYAAKKMEVIQSGKNVGEDMRSFIPYHAWGPDKGTRTCPICKYGWYHGILYFVGDQPNWADIKKWLVYLEAESIKREKYLKVYFIYGNTAGYSKAGREAELAQLGMELNLKKLALTFVPSFTDRESEINFNRVDQKVENTFILYKRNNVFAKYVNLNATTSNFKMLSEELDKNKNEYFEVEGR